MYARNGVPGLRSAPLVITVAVSAAALLLLALLPGQAGAQATSFSATLSGDAEVPPVTSDGTGSFSATLTDGALDFTLTAAAVGITQAHIHVGAADEVGGVVAFLTPATPGTLLDPPQDSIDVSGSISAGDVIGDIAGDFEILIDALTDGNAYVNVHTEMYPGGEVRGQIAAAIEESAAPVAVAVGAQPASAVELLGLLSAAGFDPALQEIATTRPWIPVSGAGVLVLAGGRAEVYELDSPQAVAAALDQFPGLTANVTIWGSGSLIVILLDAPDSPAAEEALLSVLGGRVIATIAGLIPPPEALPTTGSGGLADASSGRATWFPLALASGLALVVVLGGVSARTAIKRRR